MSIPNDKILELANAVSTLDEEKVYSMVLDFLKQGLSQVEIQRCISVGMNLVDGFYRSGEYFMADLLYAEHIYYNVLLFEEMKLENSAAEAAGRVVIGSMSGDQDENGKNIISYTLRNNGFEVIELNTGLNWDSYEITEHKPEIIILYCAIFSKNEDLSRAIQRIKNNRGLQYNVKIIVAGKSVFIKNYRISGTDAYGKDELECLDLCRYFIQGE